MKAEFDKLDFNKLNNVPTSLNNLKTKVDYWDVGKLKTVPVDLKKLSNVVDKKVVKKTKSNTFFLKVYSLEKKIPNTLIHINQYNNNTDKKKKIEKKIRDAEKQNARCKCFSEYNCFEYII